MGTSCIGCKFLCGDGSGYSNYTWMETYVCCALEKNPALLNQQHEEPDGWGDLMPENDTWEPTATGRCDLYGVGTYWVADPDREDRPVNELTDPEQIAALNKYFSLSEPTP